MREKLLTEEFLSGYGDAPEHMTELGQFVFYRTYSRWIERLKRRETFKEAIARAVEYNVGISVEQYKKNDFEVPFDKIRKEAEILFDNIFNLKQALSGRTHWVGGADTKVAEKFPLSNFNCFSEETEFLTDMGIRSFQDFNHGDVVQVLNGNGAWSEAIVKNFGKQELVKLTVRRKGTRYTEDIYTTKEHLWFVDKYNDGHYTKVKTEELKNGDILRSKRRYEQANLNMCNIGIQHGIVFGDGTYDKKKGHCRISLIGDKQKLLPYFTTGTVCTEGDRDSTLVYGLPYYFKTLPPVTSNVEYIKGFIYGLLLTDGRIGSSIRISQSNVTDVIKIQDMCEIIGLTTSKLKEIIRTNSNLGDYGKMYEFTIHKENIIKHGMFTDVLGQTPNQIQWVVESIEETDRYEDVWCVVEPITNSFTLRGGLHTHNCAFTEVNKWKDISELFYLLLIGTGVGVACTKEMAKNLPPIRRDYTLTHSEYKPVTKEERLESTKLNVMDNGYAKIYVGDSKEAWCNALKLFIDIITIPMYEEVKHIKISYNSIRPRGERLNTFGGTASGHESLKDMFIGIDKVFKDELDKTIEPMGSCTRYEDEIQKYKVRPIHILDICNLIGNNVVVGGVRRTAEIFLCGADDWEVILAKYGINGVWDKERHKELGDMLYSNELLPNWWNDEELLESKTSLTHRRMSNNSISFKEKPPIHILDLIFNIMRSEGEPGFVNLEAAQKRRPNAKGLNPCAEIILDNKQVCNLTTINVMAFVREKEGVPILDFGSLLEAQSLSVRAGLRMTCIDMELPEWNEKHKRDRLIGASLTGWKDAMDKLGYGKEQEEQLLDVLSNVAFEESIRYSNLLRIPMPLLSTTVKPEGTLSQVMGGVSSGLHVSHAPYYIRRIRINSHDPLAKVAKELGWTINPEVGQDMENATTFVIDFPMSSPAKKTRAEQTLEEQFETYFMFQESYTHHNSSNTITVKNDEWNKVLDIVYSNWDSFIGVSFLSYDGGTYELAPYEEITEEEYNKLKESMKPFSIDLLHSIESEETEKDVENMESCEGGVCPIF